MIIKDNMKDTAEVILATSGAIGVSVGVGLAEANEILATISIVLAIGFSIYKFIKTECKK